MPANADDIYRRLSMLLLKGPRDLRHFGSAAYRLHATIMERIGVPQDFRPVVGVALRFENEGEKTVCVFVAKELKGLPEVLADALNLRRFRIEQVVTGAIVPNARPAIGSDSLGEGVKGGSSGTFGCLVEDAVGEKFILSCNHVMSKVNSGVKGVDPVWQPSSRDGGSGSDRIGVFSDFAPIVFGGIVANEIDAALAKPDDTSCATGGLRGLGQINGTSSPTPYRSPVEKVGWKTKHTKGTMLYRTSFVQHYPGYGDALFEDQLGIVGLAGRFSDNGDSGSIVVNTAHEAVGLVFADAPDINMTFANPIRKVFNYFGISPV